MSSNDSTMSSLSSISEDSTFGVEGEDRPPSVPLRRSSHGNQTVVSSTASQAFESLESISEEAPQAFTDEDNQMENSSLLSKRRRRSGRSRSSSSRSGSRHSSKSSRIGNDIANDEEDTNRHSSRFRQSSSRNSRSGTGLQEEGKIHGNHSHDYENVREVATGSSGRSSKSSSSHRRSGSRGSRSSSGKNEGAPIQEEKKLAEVARSSRSSGSSSHQQRSRSRSRSNDSNENLATERIPTQEDGKIREASRRSHRNWGSSSHRRSSSSGNEGALLADERSTNRRSSRSLGSSSHHGSRSTKDSGEVDGALSQEKGKTSECSRRRSRSSRSSRSVSSLRSSNSSSDSTSFSRTLDRRGQEHEFHDGKTNAPVETVPSDDEGSDEEQPGAYRISFHSGSRISAFASSVISIVSGSTTSGQSFATGDDRMTESSRSSYSGTTSTRSFSQSTSAMVRAEVAPDYSEEIEAARERGRAEALTAVRNDAPIVVAVAQPRGSSKGGDNSAKSKRRKICLLCAVLLFFVGCPIAYFSLRRTEESQGNSVAVNDGDSELIATVNFDPPSPEDCESIANGTAVLNQADMFTHYVDMQIDLTLSSEDDSALLVAELMTQLQLILLPLLVGCNSYAKSGNIIGNGIVDSNSTTTCISLQNPNCVGVFVTLKLNLREDDDGTVVVETISEILFEDDLSKTLELPPTVQTASLVLVNSKNVSDAPSDQPSPFPSMGIVDDIIMSSAPSGGPVLLPTLQVVSTPPQPTDAPTQKPVVGPPPKLTPLPSPEPTPWPTPNHVVDPTLGRTLSPLADPAPGPTFPVADTTPGPTPAASVVPTSGPSSSPSSGPTPAPTPPPSPGPTRSPTLQPTDAPSTLPSLSPTSAPTKVPSKLPTPQPSAPPSLSPTAVPTDLPSSNPKAMAAQYYAICGKTNFCNEANGTSIVLPREATADLQDKTLVVRCCSDVPYANMVERPEGVGCPYITTNVGGSCKRGRTWEEANQICFEHNARLCTREEMEFGCGYNTGCNAAAHYLWSSTRA